MQYIYQVDDTPEDHSTSHKISHKNPDVEIIHKAHRDNLDNIYMFVLISTIYMVATNPKHLAAKCSFIGFTISQFIVTIGYFTKVIGFRDMYPIIINTFTFKLHSSSIYVYSYQVGYFSDSVFQETNGSNQLDCKRIYGRLYYTYCNLKICKKVKP